MSKLKFLVIIDPLETETSEFWKHYGEYNDVDAKDIQTEVFRLPSNCFVEEAGTFTNSSRTLIWKEQALPPPGLALHDTENVARIYQRRRELCEAERGTLCEA